MNLNQQSRTYFNEDLSWLGSAHAVETAETATLDLSTFTAGTHFPNGFIAAGTFVGEITASGAAGKRKFGLYSDAAVDGRTVARGITISTVEVPTGVTTGDFQVAYIWHGQVLVNKLPANSGYDVAAEADLKFIQFLAA